MLRKRARAEAHCQGFCPDAGTRGLGAVHSVSTRMCRVWGEAQRGGGEEVLVLSIMKDVSLRKDQSRFHPALVASWSRGTEQHTGW